VLVLTPGALALLIGGNHEAFFCSLCGLRRHEFGVAGRRLVALSERTATSSVIEPLMPGGRCGHEWHPLSLWWPSSLTHFNARGLAEIAAWDPELAVAVARASLFDSEMSPRLAAGEWNPIVQERVDFLSELHEALAAAMFWNAWPPVLRDHNRARELLGLPAPDREYILPPQRLLQVVGEWDPELAAEASLVWNVRRWDYGWDRRVHAEAELLATLELAFTGHPQPPDAAHYARARALLGLPERPVPRKLLRPDEPMTSEPE
jgi:hypothetical protein